MQRLSIFIGVGLLFLFLRGDAMAQAPVPPSVPVGTTHSGVELDQMLQPIALYPDPLIGQVLSAATMPSEVVVADRYVSGGGDPNQIAQQSWDASIQALARSPSVLKWMDDNLSWTTAMGQAFLAQQQDVMDSIQRLRAKAQSLGNLKSTPQENVVSDDGDIEILPADPQMIYVPVYQPNVVYYQPWSDGSPFVTFGVGFYAGDWLNLDFDWHHHRLFEWGRDHPRPGNWWSRRPGERGNFETSHANVWRPHGSAGVSVRGGERGVEAHPSRPAPVIRAETGRPEERRSEPAVMEHHEENNRYRPPEGAWSGIQNTHETRQNSTRGQQSRQTTQRAAPAPYRPSAPVHTEGGGRPSGGGSGGREKH